MVFFVHVLSSDFPNVGITRLYIGCLVVFTFIYRKKLGMSCFHMEKSFPLHGPL